LFDATVGVTQANSDQLQITPVTADATAKFNGYESVATFNFTNNRALRFQVMEALNTSHEAWLVAALDSSNYFRIALTGGGNIICRHRLGGSNTVVNTTAYSHASHSRFRLRYDSAAAKIVYEVSADGTTWTELGRVTPGFAVTALKVYASGGSAASIATPVAIKIDSLSLD
jgi:hypothetical protein